MKNLQQRSFLPWLLFAVLLCIPGIAAAEEEVGTKVDDIYYLFNDEDQTAEVAKGLYRYYSGKDIVIPAEVTYEDKTYTVTGIGEYAFSTSTIKSIVIPPTLTYIGMNAFYRVTGLSEIELPNSLVTIADDAFRECSYLRSIEIPNSVISIGDYAFGKCTDLTTITLGNSVTTIGGYAFFNCRNITSSLEIPNSVTSIGSSAFANCSAIKEVIISDADESLVLGDGVFGGAGIESLYLGRNYTLASSNGIAPFVAKSSLTKLTIGSKVTSIGNRAFNGTGLTSLEIPNTLTSIGASAFGSCAALKEVTISDGNASLEFGAEVFKSSGVETLYLGSNYTCTSSTPTDQPFYGLTTLSELTIGSRVTSIVDNAFYGSGLTSLEIPNTLPSVGSSAFGGCTALKEVTISDGNASLEFGTEVFKSSGVETLYLGRNYTCTSSTPTDQPFYGQATLSKLTIGSGVTSIGSADFGGCTAIKEVCVADAEESLEFGEDVFDSAKLETLYWGRNYTCTSSTASSQPFYGQSSLTGLTIGNLVNSIGDYSFYGCSGLTSVEIPASVSAIGNYAFGDCSGMAAVEIPNTVTTIGSSAFSGCTALKEVTISDGDADLEFGAEVFKSAKLETLYLGRNYTCTSNTSSDQPFYDQDSLTKLTIGNAVTAIGTAAFDGCSGLTSVEIPNTVTSISDYAFYGCSGLTSIKIPASVPSIGNYAFGECSGLTSIVIPNTVTSIGSSAFSGSGLKEVTISDAKTGLEIGTEAFKSAKIETLYLGRNYTCTSTTPADQPFYGQSSLAKLTVGNSVTTIGAAAFDGCTALKDVTIADAEASLELGDGLFKSAKVETLYLGRNYTCTSSAPADQPFYGQASLTKLTIGNSVTSIGSNAFYGCSGLTSVELPSTVTAIGSGAFAGCSGLASIEIPGSVTSISNNTFNGCTGLNAINIPGSVTSIGSAAFTGCTGLISVEIPDAVTSVGSNAFENCSGLKELTVSAGNTALKFGAEVFKSAKIETLSLDRNYTCTSSTPSDQPFYGLTSLAKLTIGNNVTSIASAAFDGCTALKEVTIADAEASLELGGGLFKSAKVETLYLGRNYACTSSAPADQPFYGQASLTKLTIGNSVTTIESDAFAGCSGLTSVEIPNSVTTVGSGAFAGCSGITSVSIGSSVTSIGEKAFMGCDLVSVKCDAVTPPSASVTSFDEAAYSKATLEVPAESAAAYKAHAVWSKFYKETGLNAVVGEGDSDGLVTIYNLAGFLLYEDANPEVMNELAPGIYIVRQGNLTRKVAVN